MCARHGRRTHACLGLHSLQTFASLTTKSIMRKDSPKAQMAATASSGASLPERGKLEGNAGAEDTEPQQPGCEDRHSNRRLPSFENELSLPFCFVGNRHLRAGTRGACFRS